jgi:hypothetical protein
MTFIPDLQKVPHGRETSFLDMAPVGGRHGYAAIPPSVTVYTIGWIGDVVESRGETPDECISILLDAYEAGHLFYDGTLGSHTCEVCPPSLPQRGYHHPFAWKGRQTHLYGHKHHLVWHGRSLFVCPALILHYIVDHQYRPPATFIDAVVRGRILTEDDCEFVPVDETGWENLERHMRRWIRGAARPKPF